MEIIITYNLTNLIYTKPDDKKGITFHFYINYRKLNNIVVKNRYPLPNL